MTQLALDGSETLRFRVMEHDKGRFLTPAFGAKCSNCGAWLTKWDFTPKDAAASAAHELDRTDGREHRCST